MSYEPLSAYVVECCDVAIRGWFGRRRRPGGADQAPRPHGSSAPEGWPYPEPPIPPIKGAGRNELADMAEALISGFRAGGYRDGVQRASGSLDDLAWQLEAVTWALTQIDPDAGERSFDVWGDIEMINALNLDNGNELAVDRAEIDGLLDTYVSILRDAT